MKEAFESYRFNCEGKMYILMQIFLVGNGKCFVIIIDNPKRLIWNVVLFSTSPEILD